MMKVDPSGVDGRMDLPEKVEEPSESPKCCVVNRQTLPLKIVLFLHCGAMSAILPYLTIHMQEIGITIQETAIIYAILPFTSFLGPPIIGFMADKFGQYKIVLIISTIANGLFHTLLLAIPIYSESASTAPMTFVVDMTNKQNLMYLIPLEPNFDHCDHFESSILDKISDPMDKNIEIRISHCTFQIEVTNSDAQNRSESPHFKLCKLLEQSYPKMPGNEGYEISCSADTDTDPSSASSFKETLEIKTLLSLDTIDNCVIHGKVNNIKTLFFGDKFEAKLTCNTDIALPTRELVIEGSNALTFWTYFVTRIVATLFMNSCFSLLDATTLAIVKLSGEAEYGKERIFAVLGFGIISPIAGLLVDQVSRNKGYTDYSAAFYVSNVLLFLNVLTYCVMRLDVEKPDVGFAKNVRSLLGYPEVVIFLGMIFVLGSMWGFVESYLFIFLKELEAPNYLLGLTLTVGSIAGIPFSYGSEKILNCFGRVNILVVAFCAYFVRFFGYSYITSPFWCFPFEAMEAFTYHLMWIAAATYCSELAPKGLLATLTGVMGSLHYSLGKGNGAFIGGYLLGAFGTRLSFRYFGIAAALFGLLYLVVNLCWLKRVVRQRHLKEAVDNLDAECSEKTPSLVCNSDVKEGEDCDELAVKEAMLHDQNTV